MAADSSRNSAAGPGRRVGCDQRIERASDGKTKPFTFAILFLWTKIDGVWMCKGDFFVRGSLRSGKLAASRDTGEMSRPEAQ